MDNHGAEIGLLFSGFLQLNRLLDAALVKLRIAHRHGGLACECAQEFDLLAGEFVFFFLKECDDAQNLVLRDQRKLNKSNQAVAAQELRAKIARESVWLLQTIKGAISGAELSGPLLRIDLRLPFVLVDILARRRYQSAGFFVEQLHCNNRIRKQSIDLLKQFTQYRFKIQARAGSQNDIVQSADALEIAFGILKQTRILQRNRDLMRNGGENIRLF